MKMRRPGFLVDFPVIARLEDFDPRSGSRAERLFFNHRVAVLVVCGLLTALAALATTRVAVNARFEKMIPTRHPYVANYFRHRSPPSVDW